MSTDVVETQRLIAHLMLASAPVEEYLQQNKPLTAQQYESLSLTLEGLQTFLEVWKRKHNVRDEPFLSRYSRTQKA